MMGRMRFARTNVRAEIMFALAPNNVGGGYRPGA
jgi:hypothetical protein